MRDEKRFWDRFSHIYTKFVSDSDRTYDEAAALIAPYIEPGMRVLELACGAGQFTLRLASLAGEWYATGFSAARFLERWKCRSSMSKESLLTGWGSEAKASLGQSPRATGWS